MAMTRPRLAAALGIVASIGAAAVTVATLSPDTPDTEAPTAATETHDPATLTVTAAYEDGSLRLSDDRTACLIGQACSGLVNPDAPTRWDGDALVTATGERVEGMAVSGIDTTGCGHLDTLATPMLAVHDSTCERATVDALTAAGY